MKRGLTAPIRSSYADAADFLRALCIFFIAWFHIWQQSWLNPNFTLLPGAEAFTLQTKWEHKQMEQRW